MTNREPRTPPRQRRREEVTPTQRAWRHYKSDSETEPESPSDRIQEAYEQKQKKKVADQKKKQEKVRKAASKSSVRMATNSGSTFKRGGQYVPGMKFRKDVDRKIMSEFLKLRGQYHTTETKAAKADRMKSTEHMLRDEKSDD